MRSFGHWTKNSDVTLFKLITHLVSNDVRRMPHHCDKSPDSHLKGWSISSNNEGTLIMLTTHNFDPVVSSVSFPIPFLLGMENLEDKLILML